MARCTRYLGLLLFLYLLLGSVPLATAATVVVNPFEIYNVPALADLAPGLQNMLASRLQGSGYTVRTASEPGTAEGDWVVNTTITQLGKVISVDASLLTQRGSGEGTRTYETVDDLDQLLPALERIAAHLQESLALVRTAPPPTPQAPAAGVAAPPLAAPTAPPPAAGAPPTADLTTILTRQRYSQEVDGTARGLTLADVAGDGEAQVVLLMEDRLLGYRDHEGQFSLAWEMALPPGLIPAAVSSGDVDGNGVPEIFVAGQDGTELVSHAFEWAGDALQSKGQTVSAFLRAATHPERGLLLLGMQGSSGADLFRPGMRCFVWAEDSYQGTEAYPAPPAAVGINLDFLQLQPNGPVYSAVTTQGNDLVVYDAANQVAFELGEEIKGSVIALYGEERTVGSMDGDIVRVSGSTASWVGPDGAPYLLLYHNGGGMGRLFQRLGSYSNGRVVAYRWDGLGVVEVGHSASYTGYLVDVALRSQGVGTAGATLYSALVHTQGILPRKSRTRVLAYDLP